MRLRTWSTLALLTATSVSQAFAQSVDHQPISPANQKQFEAEALAGNGLAAFKLANHAGYGVSTPQKKAAERYWATISAEDGLSAGSYQIGMILYADDSDASNIVRARFWLTKAKEQGEKMADFGLCLIDRKADPALPECQLPPGVVSDKPYHDPK
jgi:TPR repeat protein